MIFYDRLDTRFSHNLLLLPEDYSSRPDNAAFVLFN